jgi:hypothetical protein
VQPVVSARIKGLEAALGRRLLERTPRFVRPTPEGVAFLAKARALMAMADVGPRLGVPDPPPSEIVMFVRARSPAASAAGRALEASVRAMLHAT